MDKIELASDKDCIGTVLWIKTPDGKKVIRKPDEECIDFSYLRDFVGCEVEMVAVDKAGNSIVVNVIQYIIRSISEVNDRLYIVAIKSATQNHKLNPTVVKNNKISFQFLNSLNSKLLIYTPPITKQFFLEGFASIENVEYIYCNKKNSQDIIDLFGIRYVVGRVNELWGATIQIIEDIPDNIIFIGDCTIPNGIVKISW